MANEADHTDRAAAEKTASAVRAIWQRNLPSTTQRIDRLEAAALAAHTALTTPTALTIPTALTTPTARAIPTSPTTPTAHTTPMAGLADSQRAEAREIAHKLAGSLGMFGFPEGTVVARRLERIFSQPELSADDVAELNHLVPRLRTIVLGEPAQAPSL